MVSIKLRLTPIRLILGQKQPLIVDAIIKNSGAESRVVSVKVKLPQMLGFDGSCLVKEERKRVGFLKAGTEKTIPFKVYSSPIIREGVYSIIGQVTEHENERYDKVQNVVEAVTELRVMK